MIPVGPVPEILGFRFRLGVILVLRECLRFSFAWIMVWATAVVVLRAIFRIDPQIFLWGFVGLAAAAMGATFWALRKTPTTAAIRAALDCHGSLGGLLMAEETTDIGSWRDQIAQVPTPRLRWQGGRQWMQLFGATGFLAAAMLAPDRYLPTSDRTTLQVGNEIQELAGKLEILKQEEIIPPERAETLEKDLDRVRNDALGNDPAKTMEALDHLEKSFNTAAAEAAEAALKQTETATEAQELADALGSALGQMDAKHAGEAMKELAELARQAAEENKALAEGLPKELQEALKNNSLSPEQLEALREALKNCKACQRAKLGKLLQGKLIDAEKMALCDKAGECDSKALAEALCKCKNGGDLTALLKCNGRPGRGGISRGRGDAAMTWQQNVEKKDAEFQEKVLPPAAVTSLKESRLAGISASDPTAQEASGASAGGALGAAQAGGGESRSQTILPEHEKTIQRYFQREKK